MARKGEQVLALALRTAPACEAAEQPAAVEIGLDGARDDRAKRAGRALEALLMSADVAVEVALEEPAKGGALGMIGSVDLEPERRADMVFTTAELTPDRASIPQPLPRQSSGRRGNRT